MPVSPDRIVDFLRRKAGRPLKAKELAQSLDVPGEEYREFRELLDRLEDEGVVYRVRRHRYAAPEKINLVVGRLQTIRSGAGFVSPDEDDGPDVFIPAQQLGSAVDGDRVVARIETRKGGRRPEGSVIKVLDRSRDTVVGVYHPTRNFGFVVPEDRKLSRDFFIPPGSESRAEDGHVVVVRVTSWGDDHRGPAGEVERVLGRFGDPGVDVLAVIHGHELPLEFPVEVEAEAEATREKGIRESDFQGREDLRELHVFTIDPADAKDHDDALSLRSASDGLWEVGVHIADVAHYVPEGSALDVEALRRGTSTYLVDRVVPMLPEALSTDLCSLQAGQDRLALSLLMMVDDKANVVRHRVVRSVIRLGQGLSYDDAQAVLDGESSIDAPTDESLRHLLRISRLLRERRQARGSLDFDLPEARVILNTRGEPTDIQRILRLEAHRLIEDFMLLANETIAQRASRAKMPFLYRVHERPDPTRMEQVLQFAANLGLRVRVRPDPRPQDLQALLASVRDEPTETLIRTAVLRAMKQARYSHDNHGHFGLASQHYTHFTSPIRRYPDLVVHRLVARAFADSERLPESLRHEVLPGIARVTSERERVAVDAERDSVDLKKVEFMERHLGDEFDGTVSGVTAFGMFVLLSDFFVEGLVHVSNLEDDYFIYVEEQYALVGERTRRRFQLGDRVRVRVAGVNREERQIDFQLLEE